MVRGYCVPVRGQKDGVYRIAVSRCLRLRLAAYSSGHSGWASLDLRRVYITPFLEWAGRLTLGQASKREDEARAQPRLSANAGPGPATCTVIDTGDPVTVPAGVTPLHWQSRLLLVRKPEPELPNPPCFFVLCKRHWINRVPGAHQGDSLCIPTTLTLTLVMPSYL